MFPMSYAAARDLEEWKVEIQKELYLRKIKRNKNENKNEMEKN